MSLSFRATQLLYKLFVAMSALAAMPLLGAQSLPFKAGAAKVDITPQDLAGFVSVWAKPFSGVHDPIYARALVINNGSTAAAIVATDLVEFGDSLPLRKRIENELAIPADHILIVSSHDHNAPRSGPITPGTSSQDGRPASPQAYSVFVDNQILAALRQAASNMKPASIGVRASKADFNENRNAYTAHGWGGPDPDGPSDKTLWVVKLQDMQGAPIAILMNYAIHSVVAGPDNDLITGDLAGATERYVEQHFDNKVVALWSMGAAGDQNPKYNMSIPDEGKNSDPAMNQRLAYEAMNATGLGLAAEVIRSSAQIQHMSSTAKITATESLFSCATMPPQPRKNDGHEPKPDFPPSMKKPAPLPPSMDVRLGLIQINQIALAGVSGEVFTKIYWHLKSESPYSNTILLTMANDRIGYIADDASYDGNYSHTILARGCAENGIVNGLTEMMDHTIF